MYNSRKQSSYYCIKERDNNMPKLDLSSFAPLLEQGKNFEITEEQYVENVKKRMPATDYLKKGSPLATLAKKCGFRIQVEQRIQRVLIFTKREKR